MKLKFAAVGSLLLFLIGCSSPQWEINQTVMAYRDDNKKPLETKNAVLLDTRSGDTWMLWTDDNPDEHGRYIWKKLPKE